MTQVMIDKSLITKSRQPMTIHPSTSSGRTVIGDALSDFPFLVSLPLVVSLSNHERKTTLRIHTNGVGCASVPPCLPQGDAAVY